MLATAICRSATKVHAGIDTAHIDVIVLCKVTHFDYFVLVSIGIAACIVFLKCSLQVVFGLLKNKRAKWYRK